MKILGVPWDVILLEMYATGRSFDEIVGAVLIAIEVDRERGAYI